MESSLAFSLAPFEQSIQSDDDIRGVVYTGSLGRGTADRFSDLDIEIWLSEAAFTQGLSRWLQILAYLGEVQFAYLDGSLVRGFVGHQWRRIDLQTHARTDLVPEPGFHQVQIVKDADHVLGALVTASEPDRIQVTVAQVEQHLAEAVDSQIYLAAHNARGAIWSARGEITHHCTLLYQLLAALRGRRSYGFRYVEQLLTVEEQALLAAVWPTVATQAENRRAARASWLWTRYVWAEAERMLSASIRLPLDEQQFLAAIEAMYLTHA